MNIAEKIQRLYERYGELEGISIECQKELVAIGIINKIARAEVFLQGAQVTGYQRHGEPSILFLSKECQYKQGSALRGGVPICWPWFGDLNKNNSALQKQFTLPFVESASAHGFVRNVDWDVTEIDISDDETTRIILEYIITKDNIFNWPFSAKLVYEINIGKRLTLSLRIHNTDKKTFMFSGALHTYFNVSHIDHVKVKGLHDVSYIDALKNWETFKQQGDISFNSELDRIYLLRSIDECSHGSKVNLKDGNRELIIESSGSGSLVIWNPWVEKSQRLSQFLADDYQKMVCIETANAADDMVTLEPNAEHVLSVKII